MPFYAGRLLTDPDYNLSLGTAYLDTLLDKFGRSLVLSIAAYNAGPARVRQWIIAYGDPRDASVDVIDWIEEIPFAETRNYVQRVLENLQVYRLRLGDKQHAFTLARDLSSN
jgi:soluble lytic murein transglycosylase